MNSVVPQTRAKSRVAAVVGAACVALAALPAGEAVASNPLWESKTRSHHGSYPPPYDNGGTAATSRWVDGANITRYMAEFRPYSDRVFLKDNTTDGLRAQAELRVYLRADADGIPYDLVDRDVQLFTSSERVIEVGTPDGTGDIPEGYYVAVRVRQEGGLWSDWAYGRA